MIATLTPPSGRSHGEDATTRRRSVGDELPKSVHSGRRPVTGDRPVRGGGEPHVNLYRARGLGAAGTRGEDCAWSGPSSPPPRSPSSSSPRSCSPSSGSTSSRWPVPLRRGQTALVVELKARHALVPAYIGTLRAGDDPGPERPRTRPRLRRARRLRPARCGRRERPVHGDRRCGPHPDHPRGGADATTSVQAGMRDELETTVLLLHGQLTVLSERIVAVSRLYNANVDRYHRRRAASSPASSAASSAPGSTSQRTPPETARTPVAPRRTVLPAPRAAPAPGTAPAGERSRHDPVPHRPRLPGHRLPRLGEATGPAHRPGQARGRSGPGRRHRGGHRRRRTHRRRRPREAPGRPPRPRRRGHRPLVGRSSRTAETARSRVCAGC